MGILGSKGQGQQRSPKGGEIIFMRENKDYIYTSANKELYTEYQLSSELGISFFVFVKSHRFSGYSEFCIDNEVVRERIEELENMHFYLFGECTINDDDSDSFIKIAFINNELVVSGQLGGSYNTNFMKFEFYADQTLLKLFSDTLKGYVS